MTKVTPTGSTVAYYIQQARRVGTITRCTSVGCTYTYSEADERKRKENLDKAIEVAKAIPTTSDCSPGVCSHHYPYGLTPKGVQQMLIPGCILFGAVLAGTTTYFMMRK